MTSIHESHPLRHNSAPLIFKGLRRPLVLGVYQSLAAKPNFVADASEHVRVKQSKHGGGWVVEVTLHAAAVARNHASNRLFELGQQDDSNENAIGTAQSRGQVNNLQPLG